MQIPPEKLASHLRQGLAPLYFIHGDEPLLVTEAADAVRAAARAEGFSEREVFAVEPGFDWNQLSAASDSLSLFAERRILELRLPTGKPGEVGARTLRAYAERPPQDTLLIITAGKLEPAARKSKWVTALAEAGVSVTVWPVDLSRLPAWIRQRMRARGLEPTPEAVSLLAERVEGNLLACAQEIDKLHLLRGPGPVDADQVQAAVADSARFDVFTLVDAALQGEAGRCRRILQGLRGEGVEPVLVLWALAREVRSLAAMARLAAQGEPVPRLLARFRVWESRKRMVGGALQRLPWPVWRALMRDAARIDRVVKGQAAGNPWDELVQFAFRMAGQDLHLA